MKTLNTCLWFDSEAEEAAHYYISIFENSKIHPLSNKEEGY